MSASFQVIYSPEATDDLRNIYAYIAFELLAPESAAGQVNRIRKTIRSLDFMPERYAAVEWEPWKSRNTHRVPVGNFVVFYTVDREKHTVTVIRIFYGGQIIDAIMNRQ